MGTINIEFSQTQLNAADYFVLIDQPYAFCNHSEDVFVQTILEAIATANPPFQLSQDQSLAFMSQLEGISPTLRDRATQIYAQSAIDQRYTCIQDYLTTPPNFIFYPQNWQLEPSPRTFERNQIYQTYAPKLAQSAVVQVLQQADLEATDVTHLIVVSCTGFFAPGLDVHLIQELGLKPHIDRTMIGFMGCYAAFNGLKTAHAICQSDSAAKVLLVCVELCTLHFQAEDSLESVIINAIFGDGAAAAILSAQSETEAVGKLAYADGYSLLLPDSHDLMNWTIGNTGFLMQLSKQVPKTIGQHLPDYLAELFQRNGITQADIDFWAIHPGGRQILEHMQTLLSLDRTSLVDSYEVLRQYGNMSSCTILFILQRLLARHHQDFNQGQKEFQHGMALAFGPGLTIEGCLFQQVRG